jgi:hypothetical protein
MRMFKTLRRVPLAAFAVVGLLLVGAGVVLATAGSSTPAKVCVPAKENKPIVTPKGGACKAGYTMGEIGSQATTVIARVRSVSPVTTTTLKEPELKEPPLINDSLSGGQWMQEPSQSVQFLGEVTITAPSESTCSNKELFNIPGEQGGSGGVAVLLDGVEAGVANAKATAAPRTTTVGILWEGNSGYPINGGSTSTAVEPQIGPSRWLFETGKERTRTFTAQVADNCGASPKGGHGGGHFTIDSVAIDVIGLR